MWTFQCDLNEAMVLKGGKAADRSYVLQTKEVCGKGRKNSLAENCTLSAKPLMPESRVLLLPWELIKFRDGSEEGQAPNETYVR